MSETSTPTLGADGRASPGDSQGPAEQAKEKAGEVAGQAQEKAQEAAGQAKSRAREQIDQRSTQAGEQVSTTAGDIRSVSETLREQGKDQPARIADQAADRIEQVGSYLQESDADRILSDVEDFARRQPWAVVAGGFVLGMAAARFMKASSSQRYQQRQSSLGSGSNGASTTDLTHTATVTEGVDPSGGRFARPDAPGASGVTTPGASGVATPGASGVDTPTSGVTPPGR
jgi:gas vesicle protein